MNVIKRGKEDDGGDFAHQTVVNTLAFAILELLCCCAVVLSAESAAKFAVYL